MDHIYKSSKRAVNHLAADIAFLAEAEASTRKLKGAQRHARMRQDREDRLERLLSDGPTRRAKR